VTRRPGGLGGSPNLLGRLRQPSGVAQSADMKTFKRVTAGRILFVLFVAVLFAGTIVYPTLYLIFGTPFPDA
jgi:hypothetical protein